MAIFKIRRDLIDGRITKRFNSMKAVVAWIRENEDFGEDGRRPWGIQGEFGSSTFDGFGWSEVYATDPSLAPVPFQDYVPPESYGVDYERDCEQFALFGSAEQESNDSDFNSQYDHRDGMFSPAEFPGHVDDWPDPEGYVYVPSQPVVEVAQSQDDVPF